MLTNEKQREPFVIIIQLDILSKRRRVERDRVKNRVHHKIQCILACYPENVHFFLLQNNYFFFVSQSMYTPGGKYCTEKNYFNNLMQETFFYFATGKALKGETVSKSRLLRRDEQFINHESQFIKICGCPKKDQTEANRARRLSRLFTSNYNLTHYSIQ